MSAPVILTRSEELTAYAGRNFTLACTARGSMPLTFVWFQDEKNITGNNFSDPPPSTRLLEERRYEIQEEMSANNETTSILFLMNLKPSDTSVFLCWVENNFGSTISNFSLTVKDYAPARSFLDDSSVSMPLLAVLIAILLLLIVCLIVLRQVSICLKAERSSKSSARSTKSQQANSSNVVTDDEDDCHSSSSGSQSSCAKNNTRLLDLDGFFEHMRSGIIDIDHHSMSPAIQFNATHQTQHHQPWATKIHMEPNTCDVCSRVKLRPNCDYCAEV